MKTLITFLIGGLFFTFGCLLYDLTSTVKPVIKVDIQQIVRQTAEGLAKQKLKEDQLQQRLLTFKRDLEESLTEFAKQEKAYVVASHLVYGEALDKTDAFIAYHNQSSTQAPKEEEG